MLKDNYLYAFVKSTGRMLVSLPMFNLKVNEMRKTIKRKNKKNYFIRLVLAFLLHSIFASWKNGAKKMQIKKPGQMLLSHLFLVKNIMNESFAPFYRLFFSFFLLLNFAMRFQGPK